MVIKADKSNLKEWKLDKDEHGKWRIKAQIEKKPDGSIIAHVPSLPMIAKAIKDAEKEEAEHGKRNL